MNIDHDPNTIGGNNAVNLEPPKSRQEVMEIDAKAEGIYEPNQCPIPEGSLGKKLEIFYRTDTTSHEAWAAQRMELGRTKVGASEAAAVLGLPEAYDSPFSLFMKKTGDIEPDDLRDNAAVQFGITAEPVIKKALTAYLQKKMRASGRLALNEQLIVRKHNACLIDPENPGMICNLDGLIYLGDGKKSVLEVKTTNVWLANDESLFGKTGTEQVPPTFYAQGQHAMSVTGLDECLFATLAVDPEVREKGGQDVAPVRTDKASIVEQEIDGEKILIFNGKIPGYGYCGGTLKLHVIRRDEEYIKNLRMAVKNFVENHLEKGVPPPIDGHKATTNALLKQFPQPIHEKELPPSDKDMEIWAGISTRLEKAHILEDEIEALRDDLKRAIGPNGGIKGLAKWKNVETTRIDQDQVAEKYPVEWAAYRETSMVRVLRIQGTRRPTRKKEKGEKEKTANEMYPECLNPRNFIDQTPELVNKTLALLSKEAELNAITAEIDQGKNELRYAIGNYSGIAGVATFKSQPRTSLNIAKIIEQKPEQMSKCMKTTKGRRFVLF